jgi:hypothetical protein
MMSKKRLSFILLHVHIQFPQHHLLKQTFFARHWWLMPVILATQEAEIRRIAVPSQPRQVVLHDLILKNASQK